MFFQLFTQLQPPPITTSVAVEPVYNALLSLALLTAQPATGKVEPWVMETAARLTPQQRHDNHLLFEGLGPALLFDPLPATFPDYLTAV